MALNVPVLRSSFSMARPILDQVVEKFYSILWETYPEATAAFEKTDMPGQHKALGRGLCYIIDHLEEPEALIDYLHKLGARHVGYGTLDEHYDWVGDALLQTFAHFLGGQWTEEVEAAWIEAYGVIADVMKEGAAQRIGGEEQPEEGADVIPLDVGAITLPESVHQAIREAARRAVGQAVEAAVERAIQEELAALTSQRIWRLVSEAA